MASKPKWKIYDPDAPPAKRQAALPPPPPWRQSGEQRRTRIAETFRAAPEVIDAVNVALHLRRPLLITGKPGTGKSSLVFSVARQLALGPVFVWSVNSRSTLHEGLYRYDALARLQRIQEQQVRGDRAPSTGDELQQIADFVTLGPLGSALAAPKPPRALLIDEIDKSDVDLPNDLLDVLDTGSFPIEELARSGGDASSATVIVRADDDSRVRLPAGRVAFTEFPFIVMTSNGERDFPPPFLRRCVQCELKEPDEPMLNRIVRAHFDLLADDARFAPLLKDFLQRREQDALATDQLLNAQHLSEAIAGLDTTRRDELLDIVFRSLSA